MELYFDLLFFTPYVTSLLVCLVSLYLYIGKKESHLYSPLSVNKISSNTNRTIHFLRNRLSIYLTVFKKIPVKEKDEEDSAIPIYIV